MFLRVGERVPEAHGSHGLGEGVVSLLVEHPLDLEGLSSNLAAKVPQFFIFFL